ncbi:MAG: serine protease, partial [Planctomycetota bacterium]
VVSLTVKRGEDTFETRARMSEQAVLMESENDAAVNGPRNVRLSGFDAVMQHDTVLLPNQCGGPVLDSSGNVVGLNIARAGRVISYALPSSLVNAEIISMLAEARN